MPLNDDQLRNVLDAARAEEFGARLAALLAVDADAATVATWDQHLPRHHRLLVPVDVQALVVPDGDDEPMVRVAGLSSDPAPLADGSPRPAGVHLHWAMPDALLRGDQLEDDSLSLPDLPDRWVVVRTVRPTGGRSVLVRGWVIDAPTARVVPLRSFAGSFPGRDEDEEVQRFTPLDAAVGGSLSWTASYEASSGRFALHDPLEDLREDGVPDLDRDLAVYTVAGWWSDRDQDPLRGTHGTSGVDARLDDLGWTVDHGERAEEEQAAQRLAALRGLGDATEDETPVTVVAGRETTHFRHDELGIHAAVPVDDVREVLVGRAVTTFSTLLHGAVVGVPVGGRLPSGSRDGRPGADRLSTAVGLDTDDVVAALGASALDDDRRETAERVLAAFSADMLDRLRRQDGIADVLEHEHAEAFWALPGPPLSTAKEDVLRTDDALAVTPDNVGRKARSAIAPDDGAPSAVLRWRTRKSVLDDGSGPLVSPRRHERSPARKRIREGGVRAASRRVRRPAPRMYRPSAPVVAVRGASPSPRHHHDAADTDAGLLCRYPDDAVTAIKDVVTGREVVPTLGSGAVPGEVLTVVREAVLLDQTAAGWLAGAGTRDEDEDRTTAVRRRIDAEVARVWDAEGRYDPGGIGSARAASTGEVVGEVLRWETVVAAAEPGYIQLAAELTRHSSFVGTPPSPVALTPWRQPWSPLWIEWEVTVEGSDRLDGWTLDELDLEPVHGVPTGTTRTVLGRNPLGRGAANALQWGVRDVLERERQLDAAGRGKLTTDEAAALRTLAAIIDERTPLDVVSASLDGLREQLLGIAYVGGVERRIVDGEERVVADDLPVPLFGGRLRIDRARIVDAWGRTVDLDVDEVATTSTLAVDDGHLLLRPRLQHGARALLRLVDPAHPVDADPLAADEAFVDQVRPSLQVNPVAGWLLPDHVDEALEAFTVNGDPLGQLHHDAITGAVTWEVAPGRPLPPDAGPFADIPATAGPVARLAAGLLEVDARGRAEDTDRPSPLTELLRAIDTTLWTVDTFAALGTPTIAGLVGRPIAVVRATLRLDLPDDLDAVVVDAPGGAAARREAFDALRERRFPVRLGSLVRADDSLLGFVVDDDHSRVHVVDKAVTANARALGRHRGYLGLLGTEEVPDVEPVEHPYLVAEDELWVRPGQVLRLTLLMLPAGRVHLTSGVLPRKALQLADAWTDGLARLSPSVRVGPVLVDPSEIRMPLIHSLGDDQTFTRRTGPLTWRDDPIAAASQAALLPRTPHEVQEGWVRVTPEEDAP